MDGQRKLSLGSSLREHPRAKLTWGYRLVIGGSSPIIRRWGRLEVVGLENLPPSGPTLLIGNHDSYWDPVAIGVAAKRRRQIRALAKSTLWKTKPLAVVLDGMAQIPIERGKGDVHAMDTAIRELRARSGAGRLALAVPEATIVLVTITGSVDIIRFPKRPRIRIEFFLPESGQARPDETAAELTVRLMEEIRTRAPVVIPGRRRTAAKYRARVAAAAEAERTS
jgi:1-acyl-sn-glycerol-3-phosphate acyltransferase